MTEELGAVQEQNADLQITVVELENQLGQLILNDGIYQQIGANAKEGEPEEEPSEVQGESGVASGFIDEPGHVDGAHVVPAEELSDAESSVNQLVPAAPADLIVFPQEMLPRVTEAARRHGVEIDRIIAIHPPPR